MESGPTGSDAPRSAQAPADPPIDGDPRRWGMLALVTLAVLLGMSGWFTASAVAPELQSRWQLTSGQIGWLTTTVQLGFVAGTAVAAVLNLADVLPARIYFAASALLAAASNAALLIAPGYAAALPGRFLTGFFLAGVYPPGMKMMATWFRFARGLAIGTLVGGLTVGKAAPYLLKALGGAGTAPVVLGCSAAGAVAGALMLAAYRDGPHPFPRLPFAWDRVARVLRHRQTMLATGGYLGHMWELYAMWAWAPAFLAVAGAGEVPADLVDMAAFGAIAAGGLGCVWGGVAADRIGRERVASLAMAASGACCLVIGFLLGAPFLAVVALTWVWGFFVVADSAQFSALVTEVAPADSVGTALTLQTSMGFLLTMVTIQAIPWLADTVGWRWAFALLAIGPAAGIWSIHRLRVARRPKEVRTHAG